MVTLFDILPSLKGVTVARSFDSTKWRLPIRFAGSDLRVNDVSIREESLRRKVAFFLDESGEPVSAALCPDAVWFPALVTRISSAQLTGDRAVLHVDAAVPLTTAIVDVAFPGYGLAGARLADITIVDTSGHRRTVHAELPPHVAVTGTIALALRSVATPTRKAMAPVAARAADRG
ncbi:hypothetical protein [Gordonia aichiensis]